MSTQTKGRSNPSPAKRADALGKALAALDKQYGKGTVMRLGDQADQPIDVISTGSLGLDLATGIGGYPKGRVVEIYGPESSGKTTLALHAIASCQAAGGVAAFIDAEHALDALYAAKLGVDLGKLLVSQPDHGEQGLDVVENLVASGGVDLVVVDSVAALVPRAELEGDMGDLPVGLQARLMSQALRKLTGMASRQGTCVIFINQLRQKIGVTFGNGEVTTGGNALKFYCSLRVDVRRIGSIKEEGKPKGYRSRVKLVKNKLAPPFRQVEVDILFGKGISVSGEILDLAMKHDLAHRSGSWFSAGEQSLGQGRETARRAIEEDKALRERLVSTIQAAEGLCPPPAEA